MKKIILILIVFFSFKVVTYSHDSEIIKSVYLYMTTGLQGDLFTELQKTTFAFDNNFTLFFINSGINYNSNNVTTFYAGVGIGSVIQLQYGKPINIKENLLRVRFDIPLMLFIEDDSSILNYAFVGIYYINSDRKIHFNENYGITFSVNVFRVLDKLNED